MEKKRANDQTSKEYFDMIKSKYIEPYTAQLGLDTLYVKRYADYAAQNQIEVNQAMQNFSKMVADSQNFELWTIYFDFLEQIND